MPMIYSFFPHGISKNIKGESNTLVKHCVLKFFEDQGMITDLCMIYSPLQFVKRAIPEAKVSQHTKKQMR